MKKYKLIGMVLFLFFGTGCQEIQMNNGARVVNKHGSIKNIEALNTFVSHVESQKNTKINIISYGIEGQKLLEKITFYGDHLNVHLSVDNILLENTNVKILLLKKVN
jgi:uncharacterized protein YcfL